MPKAERQVTVYEIARFKWENDPVIVLNTGVVWDKPNGTFPLTPNQLTGLVAYLHSQLKHIAKVLEEIIAEPSD